MRGTFGNIRLKNALASKEGPYTTLPARRRGAVPVRRLHALPGGRRAAGHPGGRRVRQRLSRDWAAKGTRLLGVRAVIAQSYERIHRSNLVGMGVLPLQFLPGESAASLGLDGRESFDITGLGDALTPRQELVVRARSAAAERAFRVVCRLDGPIELDYYRQGGILPAVLRRSGG